MDRNTIAGIALIILIVVGSSLWFKSQQPDTPPSSPATSGVDSTEDTAEEQGPADIQRETLDALNQIPDSLAAAQQVINLKSEELSIGFSTLGGYPSRVELNKYKAYDKSPLLLRKEGDAIIDFIITAKGGEIHTAALPFAVRNQTDTSITFSADVQGGKILQSWSMPSDGFVLKHRLEIVGLQDAIAKRDREIDMNWVGRIRKNERDPKIMHDNTTIHYRKSNESTDYLSETKDEAEESFKEPTQWVAFKEQFFSQTIVAKPAFERAELSAKSNESSPYVKELSALMSLPYAHKASQTYQFQHYYGPLHYGTMRKLEIGLERQIPLGWSFFLSQWLNRFLIIPVFNLLNNVIGSYGIIILILTIFIKVLLLPLTFRTYLSSAKMRLLKPELDVLKKKHEGEMGKLQQAQMALYKRAGVSPFGGCLPLLLQLPVMIAMFRFFPSSIELRQQPFLWADDLSTYDSIATLPFTIPYYGDHVSLFTILMTISTIIYARVNNSLSPQQNEFKWLSYIMPVMFMGFFNNYSAGLSYYFFISNIVTFVQQFIFKKSIDEQKLHLKLEENKRRPAAATKSKWQTRLEEISNRQQQMQRQQMQRSAPAKGKAKPRRK